MGHGIGWAVKQMCNDAHVVRKGWNGKDMFLFIVSERNVEMHGFVYDQQPYVAMKTVQGTIVPWLCSQTDLLAIDWELAD